MRKLFLLPFLILATQLHAQSDKKEAYSLLWEISGNGLEKNSYLFGTMHVRDRRAFEFSDSVLVYLDRADMFASEIHPDSLISGRWSDVYFNEQYLSVENVLTDSSKLGIEALKYERPLLLQALLTRSQPQDDDKPTFVDAYLFNLARIQNKPTFGLESIQEQFGISYEEEYLIEPNYSFNFLFYNKKGYDMIELYQQGNIYDIDTLMNSTMSEGYHYVLLGKRNIHMANRMEKHMRKGSIFVAVGTAHLPGKDGMIQLLKDKGYTLRKVTPSFEHQIAANYKEKKADQQWYEFQLPQHGYRVHMPAKPHSTAEKEGYFKIHQYPDVGTNDVYTTYCLDYSHLNQPFSEKELERKIIISLLQSADSNKFEGKQPIEVAGVKGIEAKIKKSDGRYFRARLYYPPQKVIVQLLTCEEEKLYGIDAERYFNSFQLLEKQAYTEVASKGVQVNSEAGAFSVTFPRNPMYVLTSEDIPKHEDEFTYKYHLFINQNIPTGNEFTIRYNDNPLGYLHRDDSLIISEGKMNHFWFRNDTTYNLSLRDYPGKAYHYRDGKIREQVYVRGNRVYSVSAKVYDNQDSMALEQFFDSFQFTDYAPSTFVTHHAKADGFEAEFPQTPTISNDTLLKKYGRYRGIDYIKEYRASDPNNGNAYYIKINKLSDYYYSPNADSLFQSIVEHYITAEDQIVSQTAFKQQGVIGKDFFIEQHAVNVKLRLRIFLKNREVYVLAAYLAHESLAHTNAQNFFEQFHWEKDPEESIEADLFEPKATQLLADIHHTDSITRFRARKALAFYDFQEKHIDAILSALRNTYADDQKHYGNTRSRLIRLFRQIDSPQLVEQLEESFQAVTPYANLQATVLRELTGIGNEEALTAFFKLANQMPTDTESLPYQYYMFEPFFDSLALSKKHYGALIDLAKQGLFQAEIFRLSSELLLQDSTMFAFLGNYQTDFHQLLDAKIVAYNKASTEEERDRILGPLPNLIQLVEDLGNGANLVDLMDDLADVEEPLLQEKAIYILLSNGQKVQKRNLEQLQNHLPEWYSLLKKLHQHNLLGLIPAKYISQTKIAKAAFHQYLQEQESAPEVVEFIKTEKLRYQGKDVNVYVYKFKFDAEDEAWHLGICGPQPLDAHQYDFSNEFTSISWQDYEESMLDTQINRLVYRLKYR
ncbi:MAG: TraB/GumN family protein [Flammeovirgaceae bacterium]